MAVKTSTATGFIGRTGLANPNAVSYTGTALYGNLTNLLRRTLNRSHGSRKAKAALLALTGAVVGGASKAYTNSRVDAGVLTGQAGINNIGGKRTIETKTYVTGVSTAQDLTDIDTRIAAKTRVQPTVKGMSSQGGMIGKLV